MSIFETNSTLDEALLVLEIVIVVHFTAKLVDAGISRVGRINWRRKNDSEIAA